MSIYFNSLKNYVKEYTIFHAIDNRQIRDNKNYYSHLKNPYIALADSVKKSFRTFPKILVINAIVGHLAGKIFSTTNISQTAKRLTDLSSGEFVFASFFVCVVAPVLEESVFGLLQDIISVIQKIAKDHFRIGKSSAKISKWLVSPSCRVIVANTCFAATHLSNAGEQLSTASAVTQFVRILLLPTFRIIDAETRKKGEPVKICSIVAHSVSNCLGLIETLSRELITSR